MKRIIFLNLLFLFVFNICYSQLSVFGYEGSPVLGISVNVSNKDCQRFRAAEDDYFRKGGEREGTQIGNTYGTCNNEEYGCYAVVYGYNKNNKTVFGWATGYQTTEEARQRAVNEAIYRGAKQESIYNYITPGCIKQTPQQPEKKATVEPQWSSPITSECYKNFSYKYKGVELYNLNQQYHIYFEAYNGYKETIYFIISLKDEFGKERFGTVRHAAPGETIQFVEKMEYNYIKSMRLEKVRFKDYDAPLAKCDDERQNEPDPKDPSKVVKPSPPGEWSLLRAPGCHNGIEYSVRNNGYQEWNKGYNYSLNFKNRYNIPVSFYYRLVLDGEESNWYYLKMDPNSNQGGIVGFENARTLTQSASWSSVEVKDVCFKYDCNDGCYAACDLVQAEPNMNCLDASVSPGKSAADKAKEEAAEKEANAKKENEGLIAKIQADINGIPAEARRSQLQAEFNPIINSTATEQEKNTQLLAFQTRVNAAAAEVKANQEAFKADSEKRTEQINATREKNQEIKKQQAELSAAYTAYGAAIFALRRKEGKGVRYEGPSHKFSFRPGLQLLSMPVGYISHDQGSQYNTSTGARSNFHNRTFTEGSMLTPGMFLSAEYHPVFSNVFSLGFTIDASIGYWPNANDGATTTTTNYAGNSNNIYMNLGYGAELTMGSKPIKLLARFHMQNPLVNVSSSTSTTSQFGVFSSEYETWYQSEQAWKNTWAAAGIRIGNYDKARTYVDLAYTRYVPTKCSVTDEGKFTSNYTISNLFTAPTTGKVPSGFYLMFAQQNGLFIRGEYVTSSVLVNEQTGAFSNASKAYFNIIIGSSMDWFGSPKKHK